MTTITNRSELRDYCLRKLGDGINQINVTPEQIEDRINDAVQYMQTFLGDGSEQIYLKHEITAYDINRYDTGGNKITPYIEIPDHVSDVIKIFPITNSGRSLFNFKYQIFLNDIYQLRSSSDTLTNYVMNRQHIEFIDNIINGVTPIRFNRHTNRVYIDETWATNDNIGTTLLFEVYAVVNPDLHRDMYDDIFLKKYATSLIKMQWGQNLMKFSGVQLPGGIELNGESIFSEAKEEIQEIEEQARLTYELPVDFITG